MSEILEPVEMKKIRFVDAKVVRRSVSRACNRAADGTLNISTYYVPAGVPGIPQQEVTFEVNVYFYNKVVSMVAVYYTLASVLLVPRLSECMCRDAFRSQYRFA